MGARMTPGEMRSLVGWVYLDRKNREHPMRVPIPTHSGAIRTLLVYPEGAIEGRGYDVAARHFAREKDLWVFQRRFVIDEDLDCVAGRAEDVPEAFESAIRNHAIALRRLQLLAKGSGDDD